MPCHGATDADIDNALGALKKVLEDRLEDALVKLVLFGSRARGDFDESSDIDIVIKDLDSGLKNEIFDLIADMVFSR